MPDDSVVMLAYAALVVLGIIIVLTVIRLIFILFRKRKTPTIEASDERRVVAEGAIEAVEMMIDKKRREGYDVSEAVEWLNDAKDLFSKNRFASCLSSLEAAKVSIEAAQKPKTKKVKKEIVSATSTQKEKPDEKKEEKRSEVEERPVESEKIKEEEKKREEIVEEKKEVEKPVEGVEEVEKMPEEEMDEETIQKKREQIKKELESIEMPEEEMSTEALIKKKMPKDYLPAKFEIGVAESKIKEAENRGKDTEMARQHLADAKAHFEAGRYTEALGSAIKSKKAMGVGQEDHIPLEEKREGVELEGEKEQVIEVTVESGENICLNCGSSVKPGDKFCRKCGAKIQVEIYCTKCGTKAEPDDMFCGSCGTKLRK